MKKIVIMFSIILIVLVVSGGFFISTAQENFKENKVSYLLEISKKNASLVENKIKDLQTLLKTDAEYLSHYALTNAIENNIDVEKALEVVRTQRNRNEFKRTGFVLLNGTAYFSDTEKTEILSDREYFQCSKNGETFVSEPFSDIIDGKQINVLSVPIYKNEQVVGVLFGTIDAEFFSRILEVKSFGGEGYSYIVNGDGVPIALPIHKYGMRDYPDIFTAINSSKKNNSNEAQILYDAMKNKENGTFTFFFNEVKKEMTYNKISINNWYSISVVPTKFVLQSLNILLLEMLIIVLLFILMLVFVIQFVIRFYKDNEKVLMKLAFNDEITGFYNFKKFKIVAKQNLEDYDDNYALMYFDISKFKVLNDIFGFDKGNEILIYICNILYANKKKEDIFCRVVADRFSYLIKYKEKEEIINIIHLIEENVEKYIDDYTISLVFGIVFIEDDKSIDNCYDNARLATQSKHSYEKSNNIFFYDDDYKTILLKEKEYENAMKTSFKNDEFKIFLQPKYSIETEEIVGAEALCRWDYKNSGLISPNEFIPLFEKNGFIKNIDLFMFEQVCKVICKIKELKKKSITISTNFSRCNSINISTCEHLSEISKKYGLKNDLLEIEITESALIENMAEFIAITKDIKRKGFMLSIDDFGSGFSSLNSLKDIPADIIKLDREFLTQLCDSEKGRIIIENLVCMAKKLSLKIVAEGVETIEQINFLKDIGCDVAQGFYYSKPIPAEDFLKQL